MHIQLFNLFYFANLQTNGCAQHSTVYIIQIFFITTQYVNCFNWYQYNFLDFKHTLTQQQQQKITIQISLYAHSCSQNQSVLQFSAYINVSQFHQSVYIFFMLRKLCNQLQPYINHKHFTLANKITHATCQKTLLVGKKSRRTKNTHPSGPKIKSKFQHLTFQKF